MARFPMCFYMQITILILLIIGIHSGNIRNKRAKERWIWGVTNASTTENTRLNTTPSTTTAKIDNKNGNSFDAETNLALNCSNENYTPKLPDFTIGSSRISETKCNEYSWPIVNRYFKQLHEDICSIEGFPIIGGVRAEPSEFPHMAAIGWLGANNKWYFLCGSTLISPNFVLTSAHCSMSSSLDTRLADTTPKIVRLGQTQLSDDIALNPLRDRNIKRIINHPSFKPPKKYFDIALIEMDRDVQFGMNILPACLWTWPDFSKIYTQVTVTGWGVTEEKSLKTEKNLQVGKVEIIEFEKCKTLMQSNCNRLWCGLKDNQVCAGKLEGGVDTCQGDSGGPLQVEVDFYGRRGLFIVRPFMYHVIGVTSFGIGCARASSPGIYTNVYSFLDWIEPIVWPQDS